MPFAARVSDPTTHGGSLVPGPGCPTVLIGGLPAWRALSPAGAAALANKIADAAAQITKARATADAAKGTPGAVAAEADFVKELAKQTGEVASLMTSLGDQMAMCPIVKLVIPDGPGMCVKGSMTVTIGGAPAARQNDPIMEMMGAPSTIAMGCPTVNIGG